jgi:hypothetical protein
VAFAEDMSVFFNAAEFAVGATFVPAAGGAAVSAQVILDMPTSEFLGGDVHSDEYQITYPAAALPGLRKGDNGVVDGVAYRLRENPRLLADGRLRAALLTKV